MASFTLIALLLTLSLAAALTAKSGGRHEQSPDRIVLSSRGEAAIQRHSAQKTDPACDDTDDTTTATDGDQTTPMSFSQVVSGSTPTGYVKIGTKAKWLKVIFDTGSDVLIAKTWLSVLAEMGQVDQGLDGAVRPSCSIYDHQTSSSYVKKMSTNAAGVEVQERGEVDYGSGPAAFLAGFDTIQVGHYKLQNFSLSEILQDQLPMLHKDDNISGVLGLQHMKNGSAGSSLFTLLRNTSQLTAFGYCRGQGDTGTFIWGDQSTEGEQLDVVGQIHWAVKLGKMMVVVNESANHNISDHHHTNDTHHSRHDTIIKVFKEDGHDDTEGGDGDSSPSPPPAEGTDGTDADSVEHIEQEIADAIAAANGAPEPQVNAADICKDSSCIAIMDTGSNILAGPHDVMANLTKELNIDPACANYASLPDIHFMLGTQNVTVSPKGYVMKVLYPKDGGFGFGSMTKDGSAAPSLRQRSRLGWKDLFKHLHKTRGIDLSPAYAHLEDHQLPEILDSNSSDDVDQYMCMPALVTLDKHTKMGPLYIVGTPLMQTNYLRWSWAHDDESPKMFIKSLKDCDTCKNAQPSVTWVPQAPGDLLQGNRFMRTEAAPTGPADKLPLSDNLVEARGPLIRRLEDIRYPHWATRLEDGADI